MDNGAPGAGLLVLAATPIGNVADASPRLAETLAGVVGDGRLTATTDTSGAVARSSVVVLVVLVFHQTMPGQAVPVPVSGGWPHLRGSWRFHP